MLVFRCECEQVLGVESEASKGGLGECPSCGRIIRVPTSLVNAAGKLKVTAPPQRASGAYKLIKDVKPDGKNGSGLTPAVRSAPPPSASPTVQPPKAPAIAEDLEPETLAPITESSFNRPVTDSAAFASLEESASRADNDAIRDPIPATPPEPMAKPEAPPPSSASGRKEGLAKKGSKSARMAPPQAQPDDAAKTATSTGPQADKNFTTGVTAIRHRKPDSAISDAPQRSVTSLFMIIGVIILIVGGVVWWSGVLNPKPNTPNVPATTHTTTPAASTTSSPTPAVTTKPADAPADAEKKDK